jgi:VanZ family protein
MKLKRRHAYILAALAVYWPTLFVLTHIPVPEIARESQMSDKIMHFLAYMGLMMLIWLVINPYARVNWRKPRVYWILAIVVWYGVIDEVLQHFTGRSANVFDFLADLAGAVIGLLVLTVLSFWPALLTTAVVFLFAFNNLSALDMITDKPWINTGIHFFGYVLLTLVWIQHSGRYVLKSPRHSGFRWWTTVLSVPLLIMIVIKAVGMVVFQKTIWPVDVFTVLTAVLLATVTSWGVFVYKVRNDLPLDDLEQ